MFETVFGASALNVFALGFVLAVGFATGWHFIRIMLGLIAGYLNYRFGEEYENGDDEEE